MEKRQKRDPQWMVYNKGADFYRIAEKLGVDPVLVRLMVNRDIPEDEMARFLNPTKADLNDPHLLKDGEKAATILAEEIRAGGKIRVIGDYDIDGIFSTYILYSALEEAGAKVDYRIPHRIRDGYGLNIRLVENAIEDGIDLIITCDNGIKAFDEIALAKEKGVKVVVTDHHELDFTVEGEEHWERLPEADAVVNPHRSDCSYPYPDICGAAVAWKLVFLLFEACGMDPGRAERYLGHAAFATVGDIMPLRKENRAIVKLGLRELEGGSSVGMQALIKACFPDRDHELTEYDIGFIIGPCFNAAGRLKSATLGVELLCETDSEKAEQSAARLIKLNESRKDLTEKGVEAAWEAYEAGEAGDEVIVIYVPELHESLAGIVAGRMKDRLFRPVFVITDAREGVKGSGRSIPGYPMATKLYDVRHLLTRYGGHPMAAGISLPRENIDEFRDMLNQNAGLTEESFQETLMIDMPLPLEALSEPRIQSIGMLAPYGEKNTRPLFGAQKVVPDSMSIIGKGRRFLKFMFGQIEGLYFGDGPEVIERLEEAYGPEAVTALMNGRRHGIAVTIAYRPVVNLFRGRKTLQANIAEIKI